MKPYRYILEKSSRKYFCPACQKRRFVRYIDTLTNNLLPDQYGRCDREINCSYHLSPYSNGYNNHSIDDYISDFSPHPTTLHLPKPIHHNPTFIPFDVLKKTRQGWEHNTFLQNLLHNIPYPFPPSDIEKIIVQYQLGTVLKGYMAGSVTFPFIDELNNIRAIQAKLFDNSNHTTSTSFLHSILENNLLNENKPLPVWLKEYKENEIKVSCLFGAHLLPKYPNNPVALVEAPKSAILGTLYYGFPDNQENLIWLAVYNLSSLTLSKCAALKGRTVILFPDLSKDGIAFNLWSEKAKTMEKQLPRTRFIVFDILEQKASIKARLKGYDLADYLIQFDHRTFKNQNPEQLATYNKSENEISIPSLSSYQVNIPNILMPIMQKENFFPVDSPKKNPTTESWNFAPLESFFNSIPVPQTPIRLDHCSIIHNLPKFISGHLETIHTYNGNPVFLPYLHRLQLLQQMLES